MSMQNYFDAAKALQEAYDNIETVNSWLSWVSPALKMLCDVRIIIDAHASDFHDQGFDDQR